MHIYTFVYLFTEVAIYKYKQQRCKPHHCDQSTYNYYKYPHSNNVMRELEYSVLYLQLLW